MPLTLLLASMLTASSASAFERVTAQPRRAIELSRATSPGLQRGYLQTRVRGQKPADRQRAGVERHVTPALHWVCGLALAENASGYTVECNLYSYAANNPVAFTDPTGLGPVGQQVEHLKERELLKQERRNAYVDAREAFADLDIPGGMSSTGKALLTDLRLALNYLTDPPPGGANEPIDIVGIGKLKYLRHADTLSKAARVKRLSEVPGAAVKLPRLLRNKLKHINNAIAAGGNKGISGAVSPKDAMKLGERFVGPGYRVMSGNKGLISADGLRQFRFPTLKRGINPVTMEPWSKTGVQVNFQSRLEAAGDWLNNVHLDVLP